MPIFMVIAYYNLSFPSFFLLLLFSFSSFHSFSGAKFKGADLRGAILEGAYLQHADLREADLRLFSKMGKEIRERK